MLRFLLASFLLAVPVAAQKPAATVRVDLVTSDGTIVLALDHAHAPVTTANFLRYVDEKRLDGTSFYRATNVGHHQGFVQGGTRYDPRRVLAPIAHEATTKTGLSHTTGAISMARKAPGTATGDFFIMVGDFPSMDAQPKAKGDNKGYAVFGRVVSGMPVVRRILASPTVKGGSGPMKGQMIAKPVTIVSARRAA